MKGSVSKIFSTFLKRFFIKFFLIKKTQKLIKQKKTTIGNYMLIVVQLRELKKRIF